MMQDEYVMDTTEPIIEIIQSCEKVLNLSDRVAQHKMLNDQLLVDDVLLALMTDTIKEILNLNNKIVLNKDKILPSDDILKACVAISEESKNLTMDTKNLQSNTLESTMASWAKLHGLGLALAIRILKGVEKDLKDD